MQMQPVEVKRPCAKVAKAVPVAQVVKGAKAVRVAKAVQVAKVAQAHPDVLVQLAVVAKLF